MSVDVRGREWNAETDDGLNHHGTGRVELCLYFGGLDPTFGGAYCGCCCCLGESSDMIWFGVVYCFAGSE